MEFERGGRGGNRIIPRYSNDLFLHTIQKSFFWEMKTLKRFSCTNTMLQ